MNKVSGGTCSHVKAIMSRGASRPLGSQGFCAGRGLMGCGLQPRLLRSKRGPTRTPERAPWSWVGSGGAGCPVGVARQGPVRVPPSRHIPVLAPSALQKPHSWLPLSLPQETLARLKPWPPSLWSPRATGVWWPGPARPPWSASPTPGMRPAPHLPGVAGSPSNSGLGPTAGLWAQHVMGRSRGPYPGLVLQCLYCM